MSSGCVVGSLMVKYTWACIVDALLVPGYEAGQTQEGVSELHKPLMRYEINKLSLRSKWGLD